MYMLVLCLKTLRKQSFPYRRLSSNMLQGQIRLRMWLISNCVNKLRTIQLRNGMHRFVKVDGVFAAKSKQLAQSTFKLLTCLIWSPALLQVSLLKNKDSLSSKEQQKIQHVIERADVLYEIQQYEQLYSLLYEYRKSDNDEILWRLARSTYEISQASTVKSRKKELVEEGFSYIERALAINENNGYVHKWYGILLESFLGYKGSYALVWHGLEIYNHFKRATELIPNDPTAFYLVGAWCYGVADIGWYQKKIAGVIYGTCPTATYEEALEYFEKAEKVKPYFYSKNLLFLGKCYLKLNEKEKAVEYLKKTRDYQHKTMSDREAQREAMQLLKKI